MDVRSDAAEAAWGIMWDVPSLQQFVRERLLPLRGLLHNSAALGALGDFIQSLESHGNEKHKIGSPRAGDGGETLSAATPPERDRTIAPMVGVVLVSRGILPFALIEAVRRVVGTIPNVAAVCISVDEDAASSTHKVAQACGQVDDGNGVVLLVDVFGSRAFNLAMAMADGTRAAEVVCGVNLPILLKLATLDRCRLTPTLVADELRECGCRSIRIGSEFTGKVTVGGVEGPESALANASRFEAALTLLRTPIKNAVQLLETPRSVEQARPADSPTPPETPRSVEQARPADSPTPPETPRTSDGVFIEPMVGCVVVGLEQSALALLEAARQVVGAIPSVTTVSATAAEDDASLLQKIATACGDVDRGGGVVLLVDVYGTAAFNVAMAMADGMRAAEVVCGVNLPMLLKLATLDRCKLAPIQVAVELQECGRRSIRTGAELTGKAWTGTEKEKAAKP